ncbi:D-alanyl-D-alanine carboxypeptidase [Pseudomonas rhodesiae]|nr:D-alanyl-D-alanine carboxypeptidase [Pseudomonas rhodesiae]
MIKSLRPLLLAGFLLPLAFSVTAAPINTTLPPNVAQALQKAKLQNTALSLVMLPLNGPGTPTVFNADVSVNPASTMKLVTTYAALEMLGPNHQWKTEFYTDGTLSGGVLHGNLYLKGGGDPKLNMEKTLVADARPARQRCAAGYRRPGAGPRLLYSAATAGVQRRWQRRKQAIPGQTRCLAGQPQGLAFRDTQ